MEQIQWILSTTKPKDIVQGVKSRSVVIKKNHTLSTQNMQISNSVWVEDKQKVGVCDNNLAYMSIQPYNWTIHGTESVVALTNPYIYYSLQFKTSTEQNEVITRKTDTWVQKRILFHCILVMSVLFVLHSFTLLSIHTSAFDCDENVRRTYMGKIGWKW